MARCACWCARCGQQPEASAGVTRPKIEATVIVKIAVYIAALALAPNNSSSVDVVFVISRRFKIKIERNTPKAITKTMP